MTEQMQQSPPREGRAESELDLREVLAIVLDEWRLITAIASLVFVGTLTYALTATPVYRTNALIQIEDREGAFGGALGDLSSVITGETPSEGEVEIVRSRNVLGSAIRKESLEIVAHPKFFPVLGRAISRAYTGDGLRSPPLGLVSYGWGGERIQLDRFSVPPTLEGEEFTLTALENGAYTLGLSDREIVTGSVGAAAATDSIQIFVADLKARPGTVFRVWKLNHFQALNKLSESLTVAERGKKTGILELRLDGTDPEQIASTLNAIANTYIRQNVERTSEDAARTLEFLDSQLPELKSQLDAAEGALNTYRIERGTIDLSLETQGLLEKVGEVESQLSQLELQQAELAQRYTSEHPAMLAVSMQREELAKTRAALEQNVRRLPVSERDSLRLMRDVRVANELYLHLLNRAQELKVVRAGTVGNVRVIDQAYVPRKPHKPRRRLLAGLGIIAGLVAGLVAVFIREAMNPAIRDPSDLEQRTGLPVYAIVPHSDSEAALNSKLGERKGSGTLLVDEHADDPTVESLRSLRTSIDFLLIDCTDPIVCIGGPAPAAGKSFVAANLASLFATAGKTVLLLDADMRKGHLHRVFEVNRAPGLAEVIVGSADFQSAAHKGVRERLDFLSTGAIPPNPSELITSKRFAAMLEDVRQHYDLVVVDAPPVLGAAESLTLARLATASLLVVRSNRQTPREIDLALTKLKQSGATPNGFVFNDLEMERRRHTYYGYHYYRYDGNKKDA